MILNKKIQINYIIKKNKEFIRHFNKHVNPERTSKSIRQTFLNYFIKDNNHHFIPSSSVIPYCDPSISFVNAGMNQFKNIFIGTKEPQYTKVANSQKCIRMGGKHNDLNVIGADGYHHTFFEMLGNWSFGDYFKSEACDLAWKLLTERYKLNPNQLYVTYFKGNDSLGLSQDLETKDIWRSLGVKEDRILPFGLKDNFWEMGNIGPCGPCTEIHFDHLGTRNRSQFVNKGLFDLVEIWNIVFIEFVRNPDGTITKLPKKHVDTGLGFERITSVLQNKISNYDTDNFSYLMDAINKICSNVPKYKGYYGEKDWNRLDNSYRILADHTRTITACLADGVIPEQNQKLRRIMRKCFSLGENVFGKNQGLIKELTNYVIENLGPVYPEMEKNTSQIHQIIDYEEEVFNDLQKNSLKEWEKLVKENDNLQSLDILECPSLLPAYKDLKRHRVKNITPEIGFKMYDSFGLDSAFIEKLAKALNLPFNKKDLEVELLKAKQRSKAQGIQQHSKIFDVLTAEKVPKTDDSFKYKYHRSDQGKYTFEKVQGKILKLIQGEEFVQTIGPGIFSALLLDKTNFYTELGGQITDTGRIEFDKGVFEVIETENVNDYILHKGYFHSKLGNSLKINQTGTLNIEESSRLSLMRNHTATHLINATLKNLKGATCQKSSRVASDILNFDVSIFGPKLSKEDAVAVENRINNIIASQLNVRSRIIDLFQFLSMDRMTLIPGEIYPSDNIRLIEIGKEDDIVSREPCCGTHVENTNDLEGFSIINLKSLGRSTTSIYAVTGEKSKIAEKNGTLIFERVMKLKRNMLNKNDNPDLLESELRALRRELKPDNGNEIPLIPYRTKQECLEEIEEIGKNVKNVSKEALNEFIDMEMQNVLNTKLEKTSKTQQKYIIHYLRTSMIMETVPLHRATKLCKNIPVIVISYTDNVVQARCCVPKELCSENFNAEKWLTESILSIFKGQIMSAKGQNQKLVCNMKSKRINVQDWDILLENSVSAAKKFVEDNL